MNEFVSGHGWDGVLARTVVLQLHVLQFQTTSSRMRTAGHPYDSVHGWLAFSTSGRSGNRTRRSAARRTRRALPDRWAAGHGPRSALLHRHDHILLDQYTHGSLRQGSTASGAAVRTFGQLDNAVLAVTEGVFSMDYETPRLRELLDLCHDRGATVLVDMAPLGSSMPASPSSRYSSDSRQVGRPRPSSTGALSVHDARLGAVELVLESPMDRVADPAVGVQPVQFTALDFE